MVTVHHIKAAPSGFVYIGRQMPGLAASPLGNPYKASPNVRGERRTALIEMYRRWLWQQWGTTSPAMVELRRLAKLAESEDVHLACWCAPKSCHGDVVKAAIEYLNGSQEQKEESKQ